MSDPIPTDTPETTAVDDVRRVRERIHRESNGDMCKHVAETNRIFEQLRDKLGVKLVPTPSSPTESKTANG